jgi:hypothetical protein
MRLESASKYADQRAGNRAPSPTYILEDVDTDSGGSSEEDEVELMP